MPDFVVIEIREAGSACSLSHRERVGVRVTEIQLNLGHAKIAGA
jgi:hypothetical protein